MLLNEINRLRKLSGMSLQESLSMENVVNAVKAKMGEEDFNAAVGPGKVGYFEVNEDDGQVYFILDTSDGMEDQEEAERLEAILLPLLDDLGVEYVG